MLSISGIIKGYAVVFIVLLFCGGLPAADASTQVLSQLNPIMQQLAGGNLSSFLQDISKLPAAVADNLSSAKRGAEGAAQGAAKAGPPAG